MTLDPTHAALLLGVAKNLRDDTARLVYADYLQENSNSGHLIVRHYPIKQWAVWLNPERDSSRRHKCRKRYWMRDEPIPQYPNHWSLPWMVGYVQFDTWIEQHVSRNKQILKAYAEGRAIE